MTEEVLSTVKAIQRGNRKRKLEEEEGDLLRKLQRVQEEKTQLKLEKILVNLATPPRDDEAMRRALTPFGEVRLQQRDLMAFETSIELGNYSDEENVSRLYELLKGDARKAVKGLVFELTN